MLSTLVHRSIFGGVVENTRQFPDGPGFGFSRNTRTLVDRVDFGVETLLLLVKHNPIGFFETLGQLREGVEQIGGLLHELVDKPIKGSLLFQRNPQKEIPRMTNLLFDAKFENNPVLIVAPVCPDYEPRTYQLNDGVGETAEKVLSTYPYIRDLFYKYDFQTKLRIDVADVEAFDETILQVSRETTPIFLDKVGRTKSAITARAGHSSDIEVGTIYEVFQRHSFDYRKAVTRNAFEILEAKSGSRASVRDQLIIERQKNGDLREVGGSQVPSLISMELGGYAAYGEFIGGQAVILSPDAASAIPAYHFGVFKTQEFSPIIYLKNPPEDSI